MAPRSVVDMVTASFMVRDLRTSNTTEQESGILWSTSGLGRVPSRLSLRTAANGRLTSPAASAILALGKKSPFWPKGGAVLAPC